MHAYFSLINYHQVFKSLAAAHRTHMTVETFMDDAYAVTTEVGEPRATRVAGIEGRRRPVV
jgi:hypothetical protein